jgi:hypothetical protein
MRPSLVLTLAVALLAAGVAAQGERGAGGRRRAGTASLRLCARTSLSLRSPTSPTECSGHGQLVDGVCRCSSPLPAADGPGWVGDQCSTPVHALSLTGADVLESCETAGASCVCFATSLAV